MLTILTYLSIYFVCTSHAPEQVLLLQPHIHLIIIHVYTLFFIAYTMDVQTHIDIEDYAIYKVQQYITKSCYDLLKRRTKVVFIFSKSTRKVNYQLYSRK